MLEKIRPAPILCLFAANNAWEPEAKAPTVSPGKERKRSHSLALARKLLGLEEEKSEPNRNPVP